MVNFCVCDLEKVLEITQSKSSRHLRYLLNAGLLQDRRETIWIYYRLAGKLGAAQLAVLDNAELLLDSRKLRALNRKLVAWRKEKRCGVTRDKSTKTVTTA